MLYRINEKRNAKYCEKKGSRQRRAAALFGAALLCLSAFPSFAENPAWNTEDNIISFYEVPELVNRYSNIAEMEKDLISQSTKGMQGVKEAVKEQKADILDALSENIATLKDERESTEDKTVKDALTKEIAKLEKVKSSKRILPGLDSSLVEANYALPNWRRRIRK